MPTSEQKTNSDRNRIYYFLVSATLIAYVSRISELLPFLNFLRINLFLFIVTTILFVATGAKSRIKAEEKVEMYLILLFLLLAFLSIPFSVWPGNAYETCKNSLFINTALFLFCLSSIQTEQQLFSTIKHIIVCCSALLLGLYFRPVIFEGYRVTTTMTYDPNDIALLFAFTFPLVLSFFTFAKFKGKVLSSIVLAALILGIIKTGSRGGILALGVSSVLIFFSSNINLKLFYKFMVVILVVMFILSPKGEQLRMRFTSLISGQDYNIASSETAAGGRLAIWKSGVKLFIKNPLLGIGAGNSSTAMGLEHGDYGWKTMHNSYLQAAVEMGFLGIILYLAMLRRILVNCRQTIQYYSKNKSQSAIYRVSIARALSIGVAAYMVAAFFLSQAFSVIVPLSLALSSKLKNIGDENN